MARRSAYEPYRPVKRPEGAADVQPKYRLLVHKRLVKRWKQLPRRVGLEAIQQFYDHVTQTPGQRPKVNRATILKGKAGKPKAPGFSETWHYEVSSSGRIDYQFNQAYTGGSAGDPHGVVWVFDIQLSSH